MESFSAYDQSRTRSIGTDLPEIINSIESSLLDHGNINVGDSLGSALTQISLVLGLFPFLGRVFK
jgi:cation:H+ antiporter